MAMRITFVCSECGKKITSWSDGNPYLIESDGKKRYCYHPEDNGLLKDCIGNDVPYICLECGCEFLSDTREPATSCTECEKENISSTYDLEGKKCPDCDKGVFAQDRNDIAIS